MLKKCINGMYAFVEDSNTENSVNIVLFIVLFHMLYLSIHCFWSPTLQEREHETTASISDNIRFSLTNQKRACAGHVMCTCTVTVNQTSYNLVARNLHDNFMILSSCIKPHTVITHIIHISHSLSLYSI